MRVDLDCIRDVLVTLDNAEDTLSFDELSAKLSSYSSKALIFASEQLETAECIEWNPVYANSELVYAEYCLVALRGHKLCQALSDDKKWSKVLTKIGSKAAELSLSALSEAAIQILISSN